MIALLIGGGVLVVAGGVYIAGAARPSVLRGAGLLLALVGGWFVGIGIGVAIF